MEIIREGFKVGGEIAFECEECACVFIGTGEEYDSDGFVAICPCPHCGERIGTNILVSARLLDKIGDRKTN